MCRKIRKEFFERINQKNVKSDFVLSQNKSKEFCVSLRIASRSSARAELSGTLRN